MKVDRNLISSVTDPCTRVAPGTMREAACHSSRAQVKAVRSTRVDEGDLRILGSMYFPHHAARLNAAARPLRASPCTKSQSPRLSCEPGVAQAGEPGGHRTSASRLLRQLRRRGQPGDSQPSK